MDINILEQNTRFLPKAGNMVLVSASKDKVIIEFDNSTVELSHEEAVLLVNSLANHLGFRVYFLKPYVKFTVESANTIIVDIYEGRNAVSMKVHADIIKAYIDVINTHKGEEMKKREFVEDALVILLRNDLFKDDIAKFFYRRKFDWEKFFGDRRRYYLYYRAPALLLEKLDKIFLTKGKVKILKEAEFGEILSK